MRIAVVEVTAWLEIIAVATEITAVVMTVIAVEIAAEILTIIPAGAAAVIFLTETTFARAAVVALRLVAAVSVTTVEASATR